MFCSKLVRLFLVTFIICGLNAQEEKRGLAGDARNFKLCPVQKATSSKDPTMDAGRLGPERLIDGKLPMDGWRSTWTAWFKANPVLDFDLGSTKRVGVIRIYFQPWDREDELAEVGVEVSLDGEKFLPFNQYRGFISSKGKGAWAEIDLRAIKARFFRLSPKYQGWGNLWGEVEFWEIVD